MKMTYALFAFVVLVQSAAQIFEKYGMNQIGKIETINFNLIIRVIANPFVVSGVSLSFIGLVMWLVVLSRANVSYLYPFGAISYIILSLMAVWILHEHIGITQGVGILIIVAGTILLNIK